jgi:1,4-alpha-glucan branching enzyme
MVRLLKALWKLFILASVFGIGYIIGREHSFEEDESWDEEETGDTTKTPESTDSTEKSAPSGTAAEAPGNGESSPVPFEFSDEKATSVSVVGDFNDWNKDTTPMTNEQGVWRVNIPLKKGRHEYKFVINNTDWIIDPKCPETVADKYGGKSSVLAV